MATGALSLGRTAFRQAITIGSLAGLAIRQSCPLVLSGISLDNGADQPAETFMQIVMARHIVHFHALADAAYKPGFPQHLEVLGQRGFRYATVADFQKCRTGLRAIAPGDFYKNPGAHRIRQGMQDTLDGNITGCGVNYRSHENIYNRVLTKSPLVHILRTILVQ